MKKIVIGWGRMNPITTGHELLVNKIKSVARSMGAEAAVYLTHSHDSKKNPLDYATKVSYAKKAFGSVVKVSPHKNIIDVMKSLKGYDEVTVVVGSDRVLEFKTFLNKYNDKEFKVKKLEVVSAGERDPDSDDVSGMSASKMRALASAEDLNGFKSGLPDRLKSSAAAVMKKVRKGLMMEDVENNTVDEMDEGLDYAQRRKRAQIFKRYSAKITAARRRALSRSSTNKTIMKRSRREAIGRMKARLVRGRDIASLSAPEKARIEDIIAKRKKAVVRLATRLQPIVRKREKMRLSGTRHGGTMNPFAEEVKKTDAETNSKTKKTVYKDVNNKKYLEFFNADSMKEEFNDFLLQNGFFSEDELVDINVEDLVEEIFSESDLSEKGKGLWANIHAKRERIKRGSGERMRKPGSKGAPTNADFKASQTEETKLDEAIKLKTKVKIHAPGKSYHGQVGYVGEIRHGLHKKAPKTYTVDYGDRKSIQLGKENIRVHKES